MPNIRGAVKRSRQALNRRTANAAAKTELRTLLRQVRDLIARKDPQAQELLKQITRRLDQAADKGIIHPNKASRHVSRLSRQLQRQ